MKLKKRKSIHEREWAYWIESDEPQVARGADSDGRRIDDIVQGLRPPLIAAIATRPEEEEERAMADLFIAAPDLLEALELLTSGLSEDLRKTSRLSGETNGSIQQSRAAIAKARGETP